MRCLYGSSNIVRKTGAALVGESWTGELADAAERGKSVTLTEDGFINRTILRARATWFMGLDGTQKDFVARREQRLAAKP
jgi:hypothetical protein